MNLFKRLLTYWDSKLYYKTLQNDQQEKIPSDKDYDAWFNCYVKAYEDANNELHSKFKTNVQLKSSSYKTPIDEKFGMIKHLQSVIKDLELQNANLKKNLIQALLAGEQVTC